MRVYSCVWLSDDFRVSVKCYRQAQSGFHFLAKHITSDIFCTGSSTALQTIQCPFTLVRSSIRPTGAEKVRTVPRIPVARGSKMAARFLDSIASLIC